MNKKENLHRLSRLKPGEGGLIERVDGSREVAISLLERGVGVGETVSFVRTAPLGDPIEIEIMNYRLAIRRTEADRIFVKKEQV